MASIRIQHRIDPNLKAEAEMILAKQGIKASQAITIFYTEIKRTGGFPFLPSKIPNKELQKDLTKGRTGIGVRIYKNKRALFDSLKKL